MKCATLGLCIALALATTAQAGDMPASADDIISLARNGLSNETILVFVQNRPVEFTTDCPEMTSPCSVSTRS